MYNVSVSPHIRDKSSTRKIMIDVCIALIPTLAFGVWSFGWNALIVIISSVLSCVVSEAVFELIVKKPVTVFDFSAVVTGLILALNMPPNIAWWVPAVGGVFAVVIVKMLFGGLGQNIMNPALAARCFLLISFASRMTDFSVDGVSSATLVDGTSSATAVDSISSATPLEILKSGGSIDLLNAFLGIDKPGCIGEVSVLAILIGAAYLLIKRVISIRIPAVYILSSALFIFLFTLANTGMPTWQYMLGELLSGGLMAGAFFMATDYTTSPITKWGQVIYAAVIGFLIAVFRVLGSSTEGVSYAIIISNLLVPILEKVTVPKPFGVKKKEKKEA